MPIVKARQCPFTKAYFSPLARKEYAAHLAAIRQQQTSTRISNREIKVFDDWLAEHRSRISTHAELVSWLKDGAILRAMNHVNRSRNRDEMAVCTFELLDVAVDGKYKEECSNTHAAPDGYKTNWGGYRTKEGVPRGYPGFAGRIHVKYNGSYPSFSLSDGISRLGLHTGSGGANQWGLTIFSADWPGLALSVERIAEIREQKQIVARLSGGYYREFSITLEDL